MFCAFLDQRVLVVLLKDDVILPSLLMRLRVGMVMMMAVSVTVTVVAVMTMVTRRTGRGRVKRKVLIRGEDRGAGDQAAVES